MKVIDPQIIESVNNKIIQFFTGDFSTYFSGSYHINCLPELDETGQILLVLVHLVNRNDIDLEKFEENISKEIKAITHFPIKHQSDFVGNVFVVKFQTQYSLKISIKPVW